MTATKRMHLTVQKKRKVQRQKLKMQRVQKVNRVGHKRKVVVDTTITGEQLTKLIVCIVDLTCVLCLLMLSTM